MTLSLIIALQATTQTSNFVKIDNCAACNRIHYYMWLFQVDGLNSIRKSFSGSHLLDLNREKWYLIGNISAVNLYIFKS